MITHPESPSDAAEGAAVPDQPGAGTPQPSTPTHPQPGRNWPGTRTPQPSTPTHPQPGRNWPGTRTPQPSTPTHPQPGRNWPGTRTPQPSTPTHPQPGRNWPGTRTPQPSTPTHPQPGRGGVRTMPKDNAVIISGLYKRFGPFVALNGLSLEVPRGSVYGLIGPNGAGKTTTFAVVASLLKPTAAGSLSVLGHSPVDSPMEVRKILGYMPDSLGVYEDLNVEEYLRFFAAAYKIPVEARSDLLDGLLELVALENKRSSLVDSLSRGMKQRLSLARALIHDPEVLILDEPASGLDPRARSELRALLVQLSGMGKTIVISSHILLELEDVCTHIAIMQAGQVLEAGPITEIANRLTTVRRLKARYADGTVQEMTVQNSEEQAALLRRLANDEERALVEFTQVGGGLEEAFLHLTQGEE